MNVLTVLVFLTTSSAISSARGRTCSGFGNVSLKRLLRSAWEAG